MVRVARESQRIQPQGIDDRQLEQSQSRRGGGEMGAIEGEQIVPENEAATVGQRIETGERRSKVAAAAAQLLAAVATHRCQLPDAPGAQPDLEVDRQASWPERPHARQARWSIAHGRDDNRQRRCRGVAGAGGWRARPGPRGASRDFPASKAAGERFCPILRRGFCTGGASSQRMGPVSGRGRRDHPQQKTGWKMSDSDDMVFIDDERQPVEEPDEARPWLVLVADDDDGVHEVTRFALGTMSILGRPLALLHARSGAEALVVLRQQPDIAVILLDVVMESDDAGLQLVDAIRSDQSLANTRIILRTGQPGHAPETETISRYDINDYKTKAELSESRLFASLTMAIRSYDQLQRLDAHRRGLEMIVTASNQLNAKPGVRAFAEGLITQIAALVGVSADGLVCACAEKPGQTTDGCEYQVIAAAGQFAPLIHHRLSEIDDKRIAFALREALTSRASHVDRLSATLFFAKADDEGFAAYIASAQPIPPIDQKLLEVFCSNIALCAKNVDLVAELRRDAFVDRQLGMPNRNALIVELNRRAQVAPYGDGVLAIVDVDQFATINDILGQHYGDLVLKATAARLRERFVHPALVARLAGDAFAIVGQRAELNPESIGNCFAGPFALMGIQQPLSVSAGVVYLNGGFRPGAEYLADAYLALKRAKASGLAQIVTYTADLASEVRSRARLLDDLRRAFEGERLFLVYQPQIDLGSNRVVGVEALLRWRLADGTMIPPATFIPIAEQSGLIIDLGRWLLREAMQALHRLRAAAAPELRMAVNVSAMELRRPDFADGVLRTLSEAGIPANALEIEITESLAVGTGETSIQSLATLRAGGTTVAIDDFGTGYSSLAYLERLPADRLKIDRSLVDALQHGDRAARIPRTIIALGRELGLRVVAEGVEHQSVATAASLLGCHEAQGYHFARPMPEAELVAWLATRQPVAG
ncbi:MAG: Bacteriophytochrome cph2 [Candidatus Accumulibacter sp. SK-11]|nr:MAG: Bacteriophytochrome cph2 [Candidatus Accumulibacter sp. SK-11]